MYKRAGGMYMGLHPFQMATTFANSLKSLKYVCIYIHTYVHTYRCTDVCLASTVWCTETENNSGGNIYHFKR